MKASHESSVPVFYSLHSRGQNYWNHLQKSHLYIIIVYFPTRASKHDFCGAHTITGASLLLACLTIIFNPKRLNILYNNKLIIYIWGILALLNIFILITYMSYQIQWLWLTLTLTDLNPTHSKISKT